MVKLFVIDDHFLILEGVSETFDLESEEFNVVGTALCVEEALAKIQPKQTDIILLDLFIKMTDPEDNLLLIQKTFPRIPVVILSYENGLLWQLAMFRRGVKAFIGKGEDKESMCQKLSRVYNGDVVIPVEVLNIILASEKSVTDNQNYRDLMIFIEDIANGMTIKEIAIKQNVSESAVEKKLRIFRDTYGVKTNTELVYRLMVKR